MINLLPVLRRKKKIKQVELARALNISPSYLCKVEKGLAEPTDAFKESCAVILGEPVESVFPPQTEKISMSLPDKIFTNNLWSIRHKKNIKQNKLAEVLGCSPSYLSKIEKGLQQPNDRFKKRCARILKVKETELFPDTDN